MTDRTDNAELTVEDILGEAQQAIFNPILRVWQEIIQGSQAVRKERINPQWARRTVTAHPHVYFQDMPDYAEVYYAKIDQLAQALQAEIESDDECLNTTSAQEDVEQNTVHYTNVIFTWQKIILSWELDWDCSSALAAVELAAIIEVHKMFFGDVGMVSLLDQINFEFSDVVQEQLFLEMEELKENWNHNG